MDGYATCLTVPLLLLLILAIYQETRIIHWRHKSLEAGREAWMLRTNARDEIAGLKLQATELERRALDAEARSRALQDEVANKDMVITKLQNRLDSIHSASSGLRED